MGKGTTLGGKRDVFWFVFLILCLLDSILSLTLLFSELPSPILECPNKNWIEFVGASLSILNMPDFDRIDLMNYAMYGNDFDPQWDEIRAFLKSNTAAQKELEEIKRTVPSPHLGKKRRENLPTTDPRESNGDGGIGQEPRSPGANTSTKSWWQKILGE